MDNTVKYTIIISVIIIVALGIYVFNRNGEEEGKYIQSQVERPEGRKPLNADDDEKLILSDARAFVPSTEETKKIKNELADAFLSGDEDRISEAILNMNELGTEDILELARIAKNIKNSGFRIDVLSNIETIPHRGVASILAEAVSDRDPTVRQMAINALAVNENIIIEEKEKAEKGESDYDNSVLTLEKQDYEQMAKAITTAINDSDEEVRSEAMSVLKRFSADLQCSGLSAAMTSKDDETRRDAYLLISSSFNKDTIVIAMKALEDQNEDIREDITHLINHLLGQEFTSVKEAEAWWEQNAHKYDYDLVEQQDDSDLDPDAEDWDNADD